MGNEPVKLNIDGGVATITLDSPQNRNALSQALVAGLNDALERACVPTVRVIVLTHTPPAFCAGADLKERSSATGGGGPGATAEGSAEPNPMVRAMRRLMEATQPTIAAVKGPVRAGGIGLMASCDLVVVEPTVDFAFTEVRIGVAPAIISVPILRRVSPAQLAAPFLTGEVFDAEHARQIGLVSHVADDVDAVVADLCQRILAGAPGAVAATKRLLHDVPGLGVDDAFKQMQRLSDALFRGSEAAEGMAAFLEKRSPSWRSGGA